jgi:hypothetical protein
MSGAKLWMASSPEYRNFCPPALTPSSTISFPSLPGVGTSPVADARSTRNVAFKPIDRARLVSIKFTFAPVSTRNR